MRLISPNIASLLVIACGCLQLACGGDDAPAIVPDGGVDHPAALCEDSRVHLRGQLEGVDVAADLCDFQYALVESDPWANWTKFEDGLLFLTGDVNIFRAPGSTVEIKSGMLRMPGVTASAGQVYCGVDNGSYYEARDDNEPDAEFTLALSGYAGQCGGSGDGTLDLTSTYTGTNTVKIDIGDESIERSVGGSVGDGQEFAFFIEGGFVDIEVATLLDNESSGTASITRATIALRDGTTRLMLACGDAGGTLTQTHTDLGNEYELHLTGLAPWLDCADTTPAEGAFTLTHDQSR